MRKRRAAAARALPAPGAAVKPPRGRLPRTLEESVAFVNALPKMKLTKTVEESVALLKNARTGPVALTLEDSLALAKKVTEHSKSTIALTMEESLALAKKHKAVFSAQREQFEALALGPYRVGMIHLAEPAKPPPMHVLRAPYGRPQPGQLGTIAPGVHSELVQQPVWFRNALWTSFVALGGEGRRVFESHFLDIGAGGGYAWAVDHLHRVFKLAPGATEFELTGYRAKRIAVLDDGRAVVVTPEGQISLLGSETTAVVLTQGQASLVPSEIELPKLDGIVVDVGAGGVRDLQKDSAPYAPAYVRVRGLWEPVHGASPLVDVCAVTKDGRVYFLNATPELTYDSFFGGIFCYQTGCYKVHYEWTPVAVRSHTHAQRVAMAGDGTPLTRLSGQPDLPRLWAADDAGNLLAGDPTTGLKPVPTPFAASDVGVGADGTVAAVDGYDSPSQLDTVHKQWLATGGKAKAIAEADDHAMWMIGEDGKIYNRGGRKLGFWNAGTRSRPAPGETWCTFVEKDEKGPSLFADYAHRFVQGGASVLRIAQVSADAFGNDITGKITDPTPLRAAAQAGVDVFVLFDVIRTGKRVVPYPDPNDPKNPNNHMTGIPDYRSLAFDDPQMITWFKGAFKTFKDNVDALVGADGLQFEDVIKYICIGGEVDVYLNNQVHNTGEDKWGEWIGFYREVSSYIASKAPRVKIGSVVTQPGAWQMFTGTGPYSAPYYRTSLDSLNASSDYVGFTSYPPMDTPLDDPSTNVPKRIQQMLEIAGDKPVIVEEFGYPTYDAATIQDLKYNSQYGWPSHSFPSSFFTAYDAGQGAQAAAIKLMFDAWDNAKLRIPLIVWFTLFEQHIEGKKCNTPGPPPADGDPSYYGDQCTPCVNGSDNLNCHMCGPGEGIDYLGSGGVNERVERFFGSCGLIRSNGVAKLGWSEMVTETEERRVPRGAP